MNVYLRKYVRNHIVCEKSSREYFNGSGKNVHSRIRNVDVHSVFVYTVAKYTYAYRMPMHMHIYVYTNAYAHV